MNERLSQLQRKLPDGVDGALINSDVNRYYYTGMKSSDGIVVISREKSCLFIDFRYYEKARQQAVCEVVLLTDAKKQLAEFFAINHAAIIALESGVSLSRWNRFKRDFPGLTFLTDDCFSELITAQRRCKSALELAHIKAAQKITDDSFAYILNHIAPGKTEKQIALALEFYSRQIGSEEASFDFIVAGGPNSSVPHAGASDRVLSSGDFLTLDFGAVVGGYHSDMTRTVAVGHATDEMQKVYHTVLAAQQKVLDAIQTGVRCSQVDKLARDVIAEAGYGEYFGHSLGHSVGLEIHESPGFSQSSEDSCQYGDIFTVEPGIYIAGRFGCRIEDMVYMGEAGAENLTHSPKELIIL